MANVQLPDFITAENELDGSEPVYIAQNGKTRKTFIQKVKDFIIGTTVLTTNDKTVTGSIQELKGKVDANTASLSEITQVNKKIYQQSELLNGWVNNADMPYVFKYGRVITIAIRSLTGVDVTKPVFELPSFCGVNLNTYSKNNGIYVLNGFVYLTELNASERTLTFIDYR